MAFIVVVFIISILRDDFMIRLLTIIAIIMEMWTIISNTNRLEIKFTKVAQVYRVAFDLQVCISVFRFRILMVMMMMHYRYNHGLQINLHRSRSSIM